LTSPSYDPVLARALDFNYTGSLTYQGGALFGIVANSIATTATAASSASTSLTVASTTGVFVGQTVAGTGVTSGTLVTAVNSATSVTLSVAATVANAAAITFANTARPQNATTAAAAANATTTTLTVADAADIYVGESVVGTGVTAGTTVTAISGTTITLSTGLATGGVAINAPLLFGYSYAQMSDTVYPSFLAGSIAAVKLKFGFLPASVQDAASYAGK
jgi:hypothetical protein